MRRLITAAVFLTASIIVLPAVPVYFSGGAEAKPKESISENSIVLEEYDFGEEENAEIVSYAGEPYIVLDAASGNLLEVPERDYVIGAVCAEMPASFETEALKAQAAAAHTYAERQRLRERANPTSELCGADFSNDTSKYQGYFTEEQARKYFGDSFDESYAKISAAVDAVMPYIITYEDEPIISAFHSMSPGKTESAENAWGAAVDYLVPVDSSSDISAPKYREEVRFEREVLKNKLETAFPGVILGEDITAWLKVAETSESGTVLSASVGDKTVTGSDIRSALALRSACFEVRYEGDETVITTKGYGHGVGMSQYGANAMASGGSSWKDIIEHYYPNCVIEVRD